MCVASEARYKAAYLFLSLLKVTAPQLLWVFFFCKRCIQITLANQWEVILCKISIRLWVSAPSAAAAMAAATTQATSSTHLIDSPMRQAERFFQWRKSENGGSGSGSGSGCTNRNNTSTQSHRSAEKTWLLLAFSGQLTQIQLHLNLGNGACAQWLDLYHPGYWCCFTS